ncbi:MAG: hypothetical protein EOM21_21195, partial [Gammaproteobacteria bacterium]|nr:hypothetical protein [Gammaproteobacteria bacterium]
MAGSAAGAMAGAALGPVGMLAGAIIGGAIGAWGGSKAGGAITDAVLDPEAPGTLPGPAPGRGVPGTASETPPDAASGPRTQADRRASRSGGGDAGPAQTSRPGPNATASGTGKRFGDNVETAIADASQKHGVSHEFMRAMATIESGGNPNAVSPTGASGLYQFTQRTGKGYGLIDAQGDRRFDARANADAAARLSIDNRRALKKKGIENPTDFDAYMAHQQGATGWARIKKGGAVSSEIRNNMDNNGGRGKTSEEFVAHWERMFAKKVAGTGYDVQDGMVVAPGTVAAAQAASQQSTEAQQATSAPGPTPPEAVQSAQAAAAAPAQIAAAQPTSAPGQPFGQPTSAPATQAPSGTSLQASVPPAQPATESSASATPGAFAPQQTAQGAQQQPA